MRPRQASSGGSSDDAGGEWDMATESDAGNEWDALSDAPPEPPSIEDQESSAGEEWDARSEPPEDRGIPTPSA